MTSPPRGRLVVISGPSGVGKGTVIRALRDRLPELALSVSATTRPRRAGEADGESYHFLTREEFDALLEAGGFLEWAEFAGHRYGTPWSSIRHLLDAGRRVLLEIEVQGARQVRERFPDALLVFLAPPSIGDLRERLRRRGSDSDERIAQRLAIAEDELRQTDLFDAVVVNDDVAAAADRITSILESPPL